MVKPFLVRGAERGSKWFLLLDWSFQSRYQRPMKSLWLRLVVYLIGFALIAFGIYGLIEELRGRGRHQGEYRGYALACLFIATGLAICVATRARYAAGLWFPIGSCCLCFGLVFSMSIFIHLFFRTTHPLRVSTIFLAPTFLVSGVVCVFSGHLRHQMLTRSND